MTGVDEKVGMSVELGRMKKRAVGRMALPPFFGSLWRCRVGLGAQG